MSDTSIKIAVTFDDIQAQANLDKVIKKLQAKNVDIGINFGTVEFKNQVKTVNDSLEKIQNKLKNIDTGNVKKTKISVDTSEATSKLEQLKKMLYEENLKSIQLKTPNSLFSKSEIQKEVTELRKLISLPLDKINIKEVELQFKRLNNTIRETSTAVKNANNENNTFMGQMVRNAGKFAEWIGVGAIVMGTIHQFQQATKYILDMDTAMTELNKVVNLTGQQMDYMRESALQMGKELGHSSVDIMKSMAEFGRVTKNIEEIKELSKVATLSSNVTSLTAAEAAKALNTTMLSFKKNAKDSIEIIDQWNEIQNNFRTSAEDMADGIGKVGAIAHQSGLSIQELEGYITSIVSSTGISGSEAGTALKSTLSRLFAIGEEGFDDAGKTEKMLASIGVAVRTNSGEFRKAGEIFSDVQSKLSSLNSVQKQAILQQLGGTYHISKLSALFSNWGIATDATTKALNSNGSAMAENEKYMNSAAGQLAQTQVALEKLYALFMNSNAIKAFAVTITSVLNVTNEFVTVFGGIPTIMGLATTGLMLFNKGFRDMIMSINLASGMKGFISNLTLMPWLFKTSVAEMGLMKGSLFALGISFDVVKIKAIAAQIAMTAGLSIAVTFATMAIEKLITSIIKAREEQQKWFENSSQVIATLQEEKDGLTKLEKEYSNLKGTAKTVEEKQRLLDIQKELVDKYDVSITGINAEGQAYSDNIELIKLKVKEMEKEIKAKKDLAELNINNNDKINRSDIKKSINKVSSNSNDILEYQKKVDEAKKIMTAKSGKMVIGNEEYDASKKLDRVIIGGNLEEWNALLQTLKENEQKYNTELEENSKNRITILQNSAADTVKQLENNGVTISDSGKAMIQQFSKSIALTDTDFDTSKQKISDFIKTMDTYINKNTEENFTQLTERYDKLKDSISKNPFDDSTKEELKVVSGYISEMINKFNSELPNSTGLSSQKFKDYSDSLKSTYNRQIEVKDGMDSIIGSQVKLSDVLDSDTTKSLKEVNQLIYDMGQGNKITAEQAAELISKNPKLASSIRQVGDGYVVEVGALKDVRQGLLDQEKTALTTQSNITKITLSEIGKRLMAYGSEYEALSGLISGIDITNIETVNKAQNELDSKVSDTTNKMLKNQGKNIWDTVNSVNERAEQEKAKDKLSELKKLSEQLKANKETLNKLNDPDYGVSKDKSSKSSPIDKETSKVDFKIDRYMEYTSALERTKIALEKLQVEEEKLTGQAKLDNIKKQNENLKIQQGILKNTNIENREEQAELHKKLANAGFNFNKAGDLVNNQSKLKSLYDNANSKKSGDARNNEIARVKDLEEAVKRLSDAKKEEAENSIKWYQLSSQINKNTEEIEISEITNLINNQEKALKNLTDQLSEYEYQNKMLADDDLPNKIALSFKIIAVNKQILEQDKINLEQLENKALTLDKDSKAYEEVTKKIDEYKKSIQDSNLAIKDSITSLSDLQTKLNQKRIDTTKKVEEQIVDMMKKSADEKKKILDKELSDFEEVRQAKMKSIDDEYDAEDYANKLKESDEKIMQIEKKRNELSLDDSVDAKLKLIDLTKELNDEQKAKSDLQRNHEKDARKKAIQQEIDDKKSSVDKQKDLIDEQFDDSKIAEYTKEIINNNGKVSDSLKETLSTIGLGFDNINDDFKSFLDNLNGGLTETNKTTLQTFIEQLKEVSELTQKIGSISESNFSTSNPYGMSDKDWKTYSENKRQYDLAKASGDTDTMNSLSKSNTDIRNKYSDLLGTKIEDTLSYEDIQHTSSTNNVSKSPAPYPLDKLSSSELKQYIKNKKDWEIAKANGDTAKMKQVADANKLIRDSNNISADNYTYSQLKQFENGFRDGGVDTVTGLVPLHGTPSNPEVIFNSSQASKLYEWVKNLPSYSNSYIKPNIDVMKSQISSTTNKGVTLSIDSLLTVNGNVDKNTMPSLNNSLNNTLDKLNGVLKQSGMGRSVIL